MSTSSPTPADARHAECVPLFTEVDTNAIIISHPVACTSSGRGPASYNMFVGAAGRKPFRFQMSLPATIHRNTLVFAPDAPANGGSRFNLALSIPRVDEDVMAFWEKVDGVVIAHTAKHSKEFLKKVMNEEEVRAIYTPSIRVKEDYENFLKVRFDTAPDSRCGVKMFDVNEHKKRYSPLHHSNLRQGDAVTCIVQLGMVYFFNQKVGLTVDVSHLTRYAPAPPKEFPFQLGAEYSQCAPDDLFGDDETPATIATIATITTTTTTTTDPPPHSETAPISSTTEDDEDDDEGDEEVEEDGEVPDDGSTVTIDPVTMQPIVQCKRTKRTTESETRSTSRDTKRKR
jgi:hypothetical protein